MNAVVAQKMCIGFNGASCIDFCHMNVIASALGNMCQSTSADPTKPIDPNCDSHLARPFLSAYHLRVIYEIWEGFPIHKYQLKPTVSDKLRGELKLLSLT